MLVELDRLRGGAKRTDYLRELLSRAAQDAPAPAEHDAGGFSS